MLASSVLRAGKAVSTISAFLCLTLSLGGCGGTATTATTAAPAPPTTPAVPNYTVTVNSLTPASGVAITAAPADANGQSGGTTTFSLTYASGTAVTLTAPATSSGASFSSWTGCTTATGTTCTLTTTANISVTAVYTPAAVSGVTVTPTAPAVTIGNTMQFAAAVSGSAVTNPAVTWSVAAPAGSTASPGTITAAGLYTTPYPAPATVTVTATSVQNTAVSGSVLVSLAAPAVAAGPALSVDLAAPTHVINPYIYGVNGYLLDTASEAVAQPSLVRWGGSVTSRYNYKTNVFNAASSYFFENVNGLYGMWGGGNYTGFISSSASTGVQSLMTMPVLGYVSNATTPVCSFSRTQFPSQTAFDPNTPACGNGILPQGTGGCTTAGGCLIYGDAAGTIAALTSIATPPPAPPIASNATSAWANATWAGGWVNSIRAAYGAANPAGTAGKSVAIWDLDNEPLYWNLIHRDVHPVASTYDEVTNGGVGTALAIKLVDPTAQVSGPVIDNWYNYFYSATDIENGYRAGPCFQPSSAPTDRKAHGGVPMIEYYLQQMAAAEKVYGVRLLDYVDIHAYMAGLYNGTSVGLAPVGDTGAQKVRMNSTRAYWDATYTDPQYPQPNYPTDSNYTSSCNVPLQAPQTIPLLKSWVARDYPGTLTSIDEYNFGGLESINGAVTQADVLGIFGREGLDLGMLWPTTNYNQQMPGNFAFAMFRNYDGKQSHFGETALSSVSADQSKLAVYGALRTSDSMVTVVVVNKSFGDQTATLSLNALSGSTRTAQAFVYSNANLTQITGPVSVSVTPPSSASTFSTLSATFPAQSITTLVLSR